MRPTINFGKIAGIQIGVHYSWFIVVTLISWVLASQDLPERYPDWSTATYWITAILSALLLFGSLLVHEFAHSLAARSKGIPVEGITLFILGGISSIRRDLDRPRDEIIVAGIGPATSFSLALIFWVCYARQQLREYNLFYIQHSLF